MPIYKTGMPLHRLLTRDAKATRRMVNIGYAKALRSITGLLDAEFLVLDHTAWSFGQFHMSSRSHAEAALVAALHKNSFLFFAAIDLTREGLFGPANTLLRPIFEGLVIAKYCSLATDRKVFGTWIAGEHVHVTNDVLNKLDSPDSDELREFWKTMNKLNHATIYSQQLSPKYEDIKQEIGVTLSIVQVLLCMNLHLLSRHFLTPSVVRYTRQYGDAKAFRNARDRARALASDARKSFTKPSKHLLREYCATWKLKPARGNSMARPNHALQGTQASGAAARPRP